MASFQLNPFDKENATSHLINKMSTKKAGLSNRGLKVSNGSENGSKGALKAMENKHRMSSDQAQKRRAFGDVMNTASNQRAQMALPNMDACCSQEKSEKRTSRMQQLQPSAYEELAPVEHSDSCKYDAFDDILAGKENLSAMLMNAQSIARLPTHSVGEKCNYEDHFHTRHFISDKKHRKNINKEAKRIYESSIEIYNDCVDSLDLNENLFVPPADW